MALQKVYVFTKSVFKETEVLIVLGKKRLWVTKARLHLYLLSKVSMDSVPDADSIRTCCLLNCYPTRALRGPLANPPPTLKRYSAIRVWVKFASSNQYTPPLPRQKCFLPFVSYSCVSAQPPHSPLKGGALCSLILWYFFWRWITQMSDLEILVLRETLGEECGWVNMRLNLRNSHIWTAWSSLKWQFPTRFNLYFWYSTECCMCWEIYPIYSHSISRCKCLHLLQLIYAIKIISKLFPSRDF